jgi:hypothetical protein
VGVHREKTQVELNKPIYVGMSVLDLSKHLMYDFHYNTIQPMYEERSKLLFTDTDSLCYEIQTENIYEDFKLIRDKFDWSNFRDNPIFVKYYDSTNKKVPGKFKFEEISIMKEFVGLSPKDYSYLMDDGNETLKNKGIKKSATMMDGCKLRHEHKLKCLREEKPVEVEQTIILSNKHQLKTVTQTKTACSPIDSKRLPKSDGTHETWAVGHHKTRTNSSL